MLKSNVGFAVALSLGFTGVAVAAEGGDNNLFAGDVGNMVWTLVIFLLVLVVLGKFAWGPLLSSLQQREQFIRESLAKAKADREASEARLLEYTEKLNEARAEATAIVEEGRRDAGEVKRRIEADARAEADKVIARAKREIEIASQTAVKRIYETSARVATEAAGRIIEKELRAEDHERLIAESIRRMGELESN